MAQDSAVIKKAAEWMVARGWKRRVAKRKQFDQSLFEHTLVELDVTLQLLPILRQPQHFGLSTEEEQVLLVSVVAHDVGKERPEWQDYVFGRRSFVSDVDPDLTKQVLPEICGAFGFPNLNERAIAVMENCVNLHMSHERHDSNVVLAVLQGTSRWYTLANLVYHIDNICSAKGILDAKGALERSPIAKHVKVAHHQVVTRGVSTTALHRAAMEAFEQTGWTPLLHFSDGSLYVCSAAQPAPEPSPHQVEEQLAAVLAKATERDVARFMVGSPVGNIMPKPELFEYTEMRMYLQAAALKVGRKTFLTSYEREKKRVAADKAPPSGKGKTKAEVIESYWAAREQSGVRYLAEMDLEAERISTAHPDIIVFKFFKAAMKAELIGEAGVRIAAQKYEAVFGDESWTDLLTSSTLQAAQDMIRTVDRYYRLPGKQFDRPVRVVEELAPEERTKLLIDILARVADNVYARLESPPSRQALARKMAGSFIQDLVSPVGSINVVQLARQQMEYHEASKPFAGKQTAKARYICPICNMPFTGGTKASADFVDKPKSHTNRATAHGPFGYITICDTCKYERILRQLLLGERASELIVLLPRMNIGPSSGELLVKKAQALYNRAYMYMVGDTDDPDRRLWLALTHFIASSLLEQELDKLTPDQIVDLLTYRRGEAARKKNRRELAKALKAEYDEDLEAANEEWGTDYSSWDEAIEAAAADRIADPTVHQIRAQVYRLFPQMQLVCQTPHLIMLPLTEPTRLGDDSETNAAFRRVFIALLLGLSLDASVAIVPDSEQIDFHGGEGIAHVPPVAAVRSLIGANWIPLVDAERWLRRIGLASILTSAGKYSERTGLLQVLTAPTAGHILRRIEQKRAEENKPLTSTDIAHLRLFEEVMRQ